MKKQISFIIIICLLFILAGCDQSNEKQNNSADEIGTALHYTEQTLKDAGFQTSSSFRPNDFIRFRVMVQHDMNHIQAKEIVTKLMTIFESKVVNFVDVLEHHEFSFDLKSIQDSTILYKGKIEKGKEIWWQF